MNIPAYQNLTFNPGLQVYNPGTGGPQSHFHILSMAPKPAPTVYAISTYGLGGMPRQIIGPTLPVVVNAYSDPSSYNNLVISGLMKRQPGM